ncbi:fertilization-influencing membrane protein [Sorex fumeus]|uniref:fertilization-influencing membrane protein n=1 Tax=Sorex fumeus TaxID=62283 RepID=UPI0024AE1B5A|nr:fertilization-influencing membrane protein [Sorex fumeus]
MRLWVWQWAWLAGLGAVETESPDTPDFFDYPDSDRAGLLAVARFIGEDPVPFSGSGSGPSFFNHILVGSLVVAFLFLLFQFCTHVSFQKGA